MDKFGAEGVVCGKCGEPAVPGSEPPLCRFHLLERESAQRKEASDRMPQTLRELADDAADK